MAYVRTIESPEKSEADTKRQKQEWQKQQAHEKAIGIAHQQFAADYRGWRRGRLAYKKHWLPALRPKLPHDEASRSGRGCRLLNG